MIKHIIHTGDIHIRNYERFEEYKEYLEWFINECKNICSEYGADEMRIVIAGDILQSTVDSKPEAYDMCSWLLEELDKICKTIVIAGNHDMSSNLERLDPLSYIFSHVNFKQSIYLDKELDKKSGCLVDDDVVWCLFSRFDNFLRPNIDEMRIKNQDKTFIALYHGDIKSATTDTGFQSEGGLTASYFDGVDFGLLGHIHKRQCIKYEGIPLVYCGSLIQQNHGENLTGHGFVVWDVEECTYEVIEAPKTEYGFYTFKIDSVEDIAMDDEELINL